ALAIARQNHVLHGDLKPGNVLIAENGRAKLTDFGISRPLADGSLARAGSPAAMSPEQYSGVPMDTRSDFFSLGAVLYHMLTGEHPFMHDGVLNVAQLLGGSARPMRDVLGQDTEVPEALMDLVEQMLSNDPDKRPRHTRYIRQVLRSLTRDVPLAATNTLRRESRPCFRPELPEDMPVLVPRELGRDARSRLPPAGSGKLARVAHWLRGTGRPLRAAVATAALTVLALASWHAVYNTPTPVTFSAPVLHYDHGTQLPDAFSVNWLIDELKLAVAAQVGPLHVLGSVGADAPAVVYSSTVRRPSPPDPRHSFGLALRCVPRFCVLDLRRTQGSSQYSSQAVLLSNAPFEEWRSALHGAAAALFF
ncbi:MAG: serine/threonine protein kinase, partial [Halioglobus sp.]|nr:serine/threonine protein kinase [Halioglobus sp.]